MSAPNQQAWVYASIVLKSKIDGSSNTFKLSNRVMIDDSSILEYFPILKRVEGLGCSLDEQLPTSATGSLVIDNSPNSFEFERRFSDLFERLSPIDQDVTIYAANTTGTDNDVTADFSQIWKTKIKNWSTSGTDLILSLEADIIPKRVVTRQLAYYPELSATSVIPSRTIGRFLPLVFGASVEVAPVLITADDSTTAEYAYATTFWNKYTGGGINNYYVRDEAGDYREVQSASAVATAVFNSDDETTTAGYAAIGMSYGSNVGYSLQMDLAINYVITQVKWYFYGTSLESGTVNGQFIFRIYEQQSADTGDATTTVLPGRLIAESSRERADFSSDLITNAEFGVEFTLPRPVALSNPLGYFIAIEDTGDGDVYSWHRTYVDSTYTGTYHKMVCFVDRTATSQVGGWVVSGATGSPYSANQKKPKVDFFGIKMTDTPASASLNTLDPGGSGLGYAYFSVTQKTALTGIDNPNVTGLDWIVNTDGIIDDGSGTITGAASQLLESPQHCVEVLDKVWNGSAWGTAAGKFDLSKFSSTHTQLTTSTDLYYRKIAGAITGRVTLAEAYREICRNSACRITMTSSTTNLLGFYAWGVNVASEATLTDEDSVIRQIRQGGTDYIINNIYAAFGRQLRYTDLIRAVGENSFSQYASTLRWYNGLNTHVTNLADNSEDLYGVRELQNKLFNLIGASASMESVAEFFLATYAHPHIFVEIEVPYFKHSTIDMLDVVTINHPDLMSYFGTSSEAAKPTYWDGTTCTETNAMRGFYTKRAEPTRAQIVARRIEIGAEYPMLNLTARLLTNYPKDPT